MAVNYQSVIGEMTDAGLLVGGGLEVNSGKTVRVRVEGDREKRGWYRLSVVDIGGEDYLVGAYGIWRGSDNGKISVRPDRKVTVSPEQRAAINARIRADAAKAKAQREAEAERAAVAAQKAWRRYEPSGFSAYLSEKGVGAHGLRFHPAGTVVVPMMDTKGKIWGLQIIRGPQSGNKLSKQYWPRGMASAGRFHLIGGTPRGTLLLCEGYATGATLHESTGMSVAVAFSAGNLLPVAQALSKNYKSIRILVCADDDYRTLGNPGITSAKSAALAISGSWVAPAFADDRPQDKKGPTDFNDLAALEGAAVVRTQIETHLAGIGWLNGSFPARSNQPEGGGEGGAMVSSLSVDEAAARYWGTYGFGGKVLFDEVERRLIHKDDVLNLLPRRGWDELREHPGWRVVRDHEVGFDPTEKDPTIRCNLFGGWPTTPEKGDCTKLLELLQYLCDGELNGQGLYEWLLKWLAYPIQHPGAKMHTAIVVHGPQGTGKSLFFETYAKIYGPYSRVLGQEALEDKFNADWSEKKLFILADEVLARADMYHVKNRLKGFITGDTIRVNPKNVAAHNERNQMNICFLSNERQSLVLEKDDRRHLVIWTPPALPKTFFKGVIDEIEAGGVAALHWHLANLDLGDFHVGTSPPMTRSKQELIEQSTSSEERFVSEWIRLEVDLNGVTLPFCPCLGTDLYRAYQLWCDRRGERRRRLQDLVGHCGKLHGWRAGSSERTWVSFTDRSKKNRKLVIPNAMEMERSVEHCESGRQKTLLLEAHESKTAWLTAGYWAFDGAIQDIFR